MNEKAEAPVTVVELVGGIADDLPGYAREKIAAALAHTGRAALRSRLRVVRHADPGRARPVSARVSVDLGGRTVQAHVDASTPREAVDRLVDRLRHRLERWGAAGGQGGTARSAAARTAPRGRSHRRSRGPACATPSRRTSRRSGGRETPCAPRRMPTVPSARRPAELPDERPAAEWDALVRVAELSPRLSGARPWWVAQHDSALELRTATVHGRSAGAAGQRETRISAGAALFAMRLAVAVQGYRPYVALLPDPARPEVLALLRRGATGPALPMERRLLALVDAPPVAREPVAPDSVRYALRRAALAEGAWLRSAADPVGRAALALQLGTRLPHAGLYVLLGGDGDVPVAHLRTVQALHRVVLTAAWLGLSGRVLGGPADLLAPGGRPVDARAPRPLVLLGIGAPGPAGGPQWDQRPGDPGRTAGCARPSPVRR